MQNGIPRHIANYDVERRLGRGAMGTVYLARDRELGRQVAIKVIQADVDSPDMRERFNREARSIAALNHPSIVTLYHAGQEESVPYLVLEYIGGRSILEVIRNREPVPLPRRLLWIEQLCEGLQYAHERSIIHRDIKPANLMIDHLDRLRILDFGIARIFGESKTQLSTLIGTPAYMAPEYIRGEGIDARADVFAAGAVAYELLSYQRAFSGDTQSTILHRVLSEMPRHFAEAGAADLDPELEPIIFRALSKDPATRFQSAHEMTEAIRAIRARVEMNPEAWGTSGAVVTVATDGRHATTEPAWPDATVTREDGGAAGLEPATFTPTQIVDSRPTADLSPVELHGARDEQPPSFDRTLVADGRRTSVDATDAPKEPTHETRAVTPPPDNRWRYAAIAACVIVVPATLFGLYTYLNLDSTDRTGRTTTPSVATGGTPGGVESTAGTASGNGSNSGGLTNGGNTAPFPRPDDRAAGAVDTGNANAASAAGSVGGVAATKPDAGTSANGNGTVLAGNGSTTPGGIDVAPVRTAYELFNATSGPTMPGVIYRILQRTNGGDTVVSVDPRETVFRTGRDQFRFAFRSNMDGYLYVAQKNDQGDWDVVFPEPGVNGGSNRVLKNHDYIAPGPDWFQLDPPSGTDQVFVFLSKTPVSAFTDLNRPVTSEATLAQSEIDKLKSTISMRKLVVAKGDVPAAAAGTGGSGVYVVNADSFANAVMVTFDMTHK